MKTAIKEVLQVNKKVKQESLVIAVFSFEEIVEQISCEVMR